MRHASGPRRLVPSVIVPNNREKEGEARVCLGEGVDPIGASGSCASVHLGQITVRTSDDSDGRCQRPRLGPTSTVRSAEIGWFPTFNGFLHYRRVRHLLLQWTFLIEAGTLVPFLAPFLARRRSGASNFLDAARTMYFVEL